MTPERLFAEANGEEIGGKWVNKTKREYENGYKTKREYENESRMERRWRNF